MARKLIPPRRDEAFSHLGLGTVRMLEYLEENARQTNDSTDMLDADLSSINISGAQIAQINKKINSIVNQSIVDQSGNFTKLNKRIEQLELALVASNNASVKKVIKNIEADFLAPIQKNKFNKLTVKELTVADGAVWDNTGINILTGDTYMINGINVLSSTALGLGVITSKLESLGDLVNCNTIGVYSVNGTQVVSDQGSSVSDPLATVNSLQIAVNAILSRLRDHGLIAT